MNNLKIVTDKTTLVASESIFKSPGNFFVQVRATKNLLEGNTIYLDKIEACLLRDKLNEYLGETSAPDIKVATEVDKDSVSVGGTQFEF